MGAEEEEGLDLGLTIDALGKDADVTSALLCSALLCTMEITASRKRQHIFHSHAFNELKKAKPLSFKPHSENIPSQHCNMSCLTAIILIHDTAVFT
jgi:hypothetical protein